MQGGLKWAFRATRAKRRGAQSHMFCLSTDQYVDLMYLVWALSVPPSVAAGITACYRAKLRRLTLIEYVPVVTLLAEKSPEQVQHVLLALHCD